MQSVVLVCVLLVAAMIVCDADDGVRCSTSRECECGEKCVNDKDLKCDITENRLCHCRQGCVVFDIFIDPGTSKTVYGNICHCPHTVEHLVGHKERMPACSRAMWRGQPEGMYPYERTPKCYEKDSADQ